MNVSPVNLIVKDSYTDNGNKYKKSNAGKTFATSVMALSGNHVLKMSEKALQEKTPVASKAGAIFFSAIIGLGFGTIIDGIINTINAHSVDKKAAVNSHGDTFEKSSTAPENNTKITAHQG